MDPRKTVFVTGANAGLGYEIVRALCASDRAYDVIVGGRSLTKAEHAIEALINEFPATRSHLRAVQIDLEDDSSIDSAYQLVLNVYGKLDALVNNGGAQFDTDYEPSVVTTRKMWNKTYDINVTGTHIMTTAFAPLLVKSSDPRLMFITSGISSLAGSEDFNMPWNKIPFKG